VSVSLSTKFVKQINKKEVRPTQERPASTAHEGWFGQVHLARERFPAGISRSGFRNTAQANNAANSSRWSMAFE
jgi:hypothetical protein